MRSQLPSIAVTEVPADAYLLDVREDDEWTAGHAPDAVHMPMMSIPEHLTDLPADRDVVVVCRSGGRSAQVTMFLQQNGFTRAVNLDGGMNDWAAVGRPMISEDGGAPRVA